MAIIPARGGSKRIPRKNIRPFLGIPLIARTIAILREAELFDRIVVSTDDEEVASIALDAGAEVPFRRPAELADDFTATKPVIADAIARMEPDGAPIDGPIFVVYPAAVFIDASDLRGAFYDFRDTDADLVFSASRFPAPILRAWRQRADRTCEMVWPEHQSTRSQDLDETYFDAGQFYVGSRDYWLHALGNFDALSRSVMYLIPQGRVHDLDDLEDWRYGEMLYRFNQFCPSS